MRDNFIFYRSFFAAIEKLPAKYHLPLYKAIIEFALDGEEPKLDGTGAAIFELIKPQLLANNKRYIDGCKGGRPVQKPLDNDNETTGYEIKKPLVIEAENQSVTKRKPNVNENDNENVNVNEKEERWDKPPRSNFKKPTLEEVKAYCTERGEKVRWQQFFDFYESKGWMVGKNKMKDWQAAVRTWERRAVEQGKPQHNYSQREYTPDQLNALYDNLDDVEVIDDE